ncbi:MAG: hypothetical protein QOK00_174, partial [Thermoleophilaceae bacterium]|nr:hypothetical protein [Thermoleophilaceae bacterium]
AASALRVAAKIVRCTEPSAIARTATPVWLSGCTSSGSSVTACPPVAALAADPDVHRRNGGSFSSGGLAREYGFTDVDGSQPDCWRYMVEVQDPGRPADPTGYR